MPTSVTSLWRRLKHAFGVHDFAYLPYELDHAKKILWPHRRYCLRCKTRQVYDVEFGWISPMAFITPLPGYKVMIRWDRSILGDK